MRVYLLENIVKKDAGIIKEALIKNKLEEALDNLFYIPLPAEILSLEQKEHNEECGEYFIALELVDKFETFDLRLELLVRAKNKLRCSCVCYCTKEQEAYILNYLHTFLEKIKIVA